MQKIQRGAGWFRGDSTRTPAIPLKGLYQRPQLVSTGQPVNDQTVAEKIRNGSARMPAFRNTLSDVDIADLLSYIREKCCWDGEEPTANPWYRAGAGPAVEIQVRNNLRGGPRGAVRSAAGTPLEGIMVQLISQTNSVRTTVYSNDGGRYEFPKLPTGSYALRIARPMEFRPYQRDSVQIDGATQLQEIVLERVSNTEFLPPTPEIKAQLTGAEWLMNLPGTGEEKRTFLRFCNWCHSYQQIFKNRYDENSWKLIVERMTRYRLSILVDAYSPGEGGESPEQRNLIAKWLARVRAPGSEDTPLQVLPGPRGAATRVIVTEYELPVLRKNSMELQDRAFSRLPPS